MSDTIRSVQRALDLMQVMNGRESWTLLDLSTATSLPKTTVFRLLQTLEDSGFVCKPRDRPGVYRLTSKTQVLSAGLTETTRFADVADPIVIAATEALDWPVSFATPDGPHMRIICCGVPYCRKHAARPTSLGVRLCVFSSALGKAYLSRCSADEVAAIRRGAEGFAPEAGTGHRVPSLTYLLAEAERNRTQGYAIRPACPTDVTAALAVPVTAAGRVIGAVSCSTFPNSLSGRFIQAVLAGLQQAAAEVAAACATCGAGADRPVAAASDLARLAA